MATAVKNEAGVTPARSTLLSKPLFLGVLLLVVSAGMAGTLLVLLNGDEAHEDELALTTEEGSDAVEVAIDSFSTTNSRAAPGSVIHVTFKLTAVVASDSSRVRHSAATDGGDGSAQTGAVRRSARRATA